MVKTNKNQTKGKERIETEPRENKRRRIGKIKKNKEKKGGN